MANGIDIYGNYILPAATGVKNAAISLFKSDDAPGDYSSRRSSLARQQKLAEALSQMGAQEQAVSTAGGITAPVSPMGALARGLTSFGGAYLSGKAAADEAALKKAETADALAQIGKIYRLPDRTGLVPSTAPAGTTSTPVTVSMPTLPGQKPSDVSTTMNLDLPNAPRVQTGTIPGRARTYAEQQQMLNQWAMGDNSKLAAIAPIIAAQLKPEYVAGSQYGTNKINPDGTIEQAIAPFGKPVRAVRPATDKDLIGYEPGTSAQVFLDTGELTNIQRPYHDASPHVSVKVEDKGADAYVTEVGKLNAARQNAIYDAGRLAPQQIETAQRVKSVLMGPNVMTGTAADIKLAFAKAFYGNTASVNDTQTLITDLSKGTLSAIKTSGLGTSQGFTDKDLEFLRAATAGTVNFTKDALFRLADLSERAARANAEKGNGVLNFWKSNKDLARSGVMDDPINVPPPFVLRAPPNAGAPASEGPPT